jgi:Flp pilus assembly pilin Flp
MHRRPNLAGFRSEDGGAAMVEYALMLALIALMALAAVGVVGTTTSQLFGDQQLVGVLG